MRLMYAKRIKNAMKQNKGVSFILWRMKAMDSRNIITKQEFPLQSLTPVFVTRQQKYSAGILTKYSCSTIVFQFYHD